MLTSAAPESQSASQARQFQAALYCAAEATMSLAAGTRLGPYEVLGQIGAGPSTRLELTSWH